MKHNVVFIGEKQKPKFGRSPAAESLTDNGEIISCFISFLHKWD